MALSGRVEPGQVGSGRVMEGNGFKHKNNKKKIYPKSLLTFIRIFFVVEDFPICMQKKLFCAPRGRLRFISLAVNVVTGLFPGWSFPR